MRHSLKTWSSYFEDVANGSKPFEVRKNDRNYAVGDVLVLQEWDPWGGENLGVDYEGAYTGATVNVEITYVLPGGNFGIEPGTVVLGIKLLR